MRQEVRITGFGGQGIVLAGVVLGKAAALFDGKYAVQTQSYGPAARGGACKCDIIVCEDVIRYPRVKNCDILIAFSQIAFDRYRKMIHDGGGAIIYDTDLVKVAEDDLKYFRHNSIRLYGVNAIETADGMGSKIMANMVMLGALVSLTSIVSLDSLKKSVSNTVRKSYLKENLKALEMGYTIGGSVKDETA